jgi:hypothetical protein
MTITEANQKIQDALTDAEAALDSIKEDLETFKADWEDELTSEDCDEETIQTNIENVEEAIEALTRAMDVLG